MHLLVQLALVLHSRLGVPSHPVVHRHRSALDGHHFRGVLAVPEVLVLQVHPDNYLMEFNIPAIIILLCLRIPYINYRKQRNGTQREKPTLQIELSFAFKRGGRK